MTRPNGPPILLTDVLTNHRVVPAEVPVAEFGAAGLVPTGEVARAWRCVFCARLWFGAVPEDAPPCPPRPAGVV